MFKSVKLIIFLFSIIFNITCFAKDNVIATRIWPSVEYTRVTIESDKPIQNDQMILQNPERIVIDLKDTQLESTIEALTTQLDDTDPSIKSIRVGQFNPKVTRIVIDLKRSAKVKIFTLKPVDPYKHRLVIDVYPDDFDSLAALLQQLDSETYKPSKDNEINDAKDAIDEAIKKPVIDPIIVAIDAGHGGEDPGARGKRGTKEKVITLQIAQKLKIPLILWVDKFLTQNFRRNGFLNAQIKTVCNLYHPSLCLYQVAGHFRKTRIGKACDLRRSYQE